MGYKEDMKKSCCFLAVTLLLLTAPTAQARDLSAFSDLLGALSDMTYAADRAQDAFTDAREHNRDSDRYERDWRERESSLERERIRAMARIAGVSETTIRRMRDNGTSWSSIARRYDVDARWFSGLSPRDDERDKWRGTPPGLAKKGGMPPGQAKKKDKKDKR